MTWLRRFAIGVVMCVSVACTGGVAPEQPPATTSSPVEQVTASAEGKSRCGEQPTGKAELLAFQLTSGCPLPQQFCCDPPSCGWCITPPLEQCP